MTRRWVGVSELAAAAWTDVMMVSKKLDARVVLRQRKGTRPGRGGARNQSPRDYGGVSCCLIKITSLFDEFATQLSRIKASESYVTASCPQWGGIKSGATHPKTKKFQSNGEIIFKKRVKVVCSCFF